MTERLVVATNHWRARVLERLGRDVDASVLAAAITWEIDNETGAVIYLGRVSRDGKRIYRFAFPRGQRGVALVVINDTKIRFITVYETGWRIPREGKKSIRA